MITRQSIFDALFMLKSAGIDVTEPLKVMSSTSGIPPSVVEFLKENSPQHQFYHYLKTRQKAVIKNILNYEELTPIQKIKVCSSFITRAMIAIECREIDESLISELRLVQISKAITLALEYKEYSQLDKILQHFKAIFSTREDLSKEHDE